jgi:hypothetical protein
MISAKRLTLAALMACAGFVAVPSVASATPIISVTTGSSFNDNGGNAEGQSLLTPKIGAFGWDDIEFNWYTSTVPTAPTSANLVPYAPAGSNVFIFTQAYTGTPAGLDSLTALQKIADGFVAESTGTVTDGSGNAYTFAPTLTLQVNTEYFIYTDTVLAAPIVDGTGGGSGDLQRYRAVGSSEPYLGPNNTTTMFTLQGTAVPEPSTLALFGAGLLALAGFAAFGRRKTTTLA